MSKLGKMSTLTSPVTLLILFLIETEDARSIQRLHTGDPISDAVLDVSFSTLAWGLISIFSDAERRISELLLQIIPRQIPLPLTYVEQAN